MPIYVDRNNIGDIYFGSNRIGEVYCGNNLVYTNQTVTDLGTNTEFNLSSYSNYRNLTADNFYFLTAGQIRVDGNTSSGIEYTYNGFTKSYNPNTGKLTMYIELRGAGQTVRGGVHAYLVTNPASLVNLGTNTTFNLTSQSGYANFTVNNFLIKNVVFPSTNPDGEIGGIRDPLNFYAITRINKTYNNGILNCGLYGEFTSGKSHTETWQHTTNTSLNVYLYKKGV